MSHHFSVTGIPVNESCLTEMKCERRCNTNQEFRNSLQVEYKRVFLSPTEFLLSRQNVLSLIVSRLHKYLKTQRTNGSLITVKY